MATLIARTVLQSGLEGEIEIPRLWSLISPRRVFRNVCFFPNLKDREVHETAHRAEGYVEG